MSTPTPEHDNAHDLMPSWLAADVPAHYSQEHVADPVVRVKFFTPDSSWTWYCLEYSPTERLCFGLVNGHEEELGYFSVDELESVTGPMGLHVERDLWWTPVPLSTVRGR
jgi:hypothetical protein